MDQKGKASILRIISDIIKADSIIDMRELDVLNSIKEKYGIHRIDEIEAEHLSLTDAIMYLSNMTDGLRRDFLGDLLKVSISDNSISREEAIIIFAIKIYITEGLYDNCKLKSIETDNLDLDSTQILYVESEFDNNINWEINDSFREIKTELKLSGFDFVYLPKIVERYRGMSDEQLNSIIQFVCPSASNSRLLVISKQLKKLSTSEFCRDLLAGKLNVRDFALMPPSLIFKIGDSNVDGRNLSNFMIFELEKNILLTIRNLVDLFSEIFQNSNINHLREDRNSIVYKGFQKQIIDLLILQRGIKSTIVLDTINGRIGLPEADAFLEMHRREKALYALFLLESSRGGIRFTMPEKGNINKHLESLKKLQLKYSLIYQKFGGNRELAPDLSDAATRGPMLSNIKKSILKMKDILYDVKDYLIQRDESGVYFVSLPMHFCKCRDCNINEVIPLTDSIDWQKIAEL